MKTIFLKSLLSIVIILLSIHFMKEFYITGFVSLLIGFFSLMNEYVKFLKNLL